MNRLRAYFKGGNTFELNADAVDLWSIQTPLLERLEIVKEADMEPKKMIVRIGGYYGSAEIKNGSMVFVIGGANFNDRLLKSLLDSKPQIEFVSPI